MTCYILGKKRRRIIATSHTSAVGAAPALAQGQALCQSCTAQPDRTRPTTGFRRASRVGAGVPGKIRRRRLMMMRRISVIMLLLLVPDRDPPASNVVSICQLSLAYYYQSIRLCVI